MPPLQQARFLMKSWPLNVNLLARIMKKTYSKIKSFYPISTPSGQNVYPNTQNRPADKRLTCEFVEPTAGLEPATYALRVETILQTSKPFVGFIGHFLYKHQPEGSFSDIGDIFLPHFLPQFLPQLKKGTKPWRTRPLGSLFVSAKKN